MLERCPESKPKFVASLHNYRLVFVGWSRKRRGGVASIRLFRGEKVLGAIYEVSEECLRRLDRFEGSDYSRLNVKVYNEDGDPVEAVAYINARQAEETKPSPQYLSIIKQGYIDWGII